MSDIASAGTFISAALETAGAITQDQILRSFQQFFHVAGAYFFATASVGAIVSVALFGSYQMARYIFVGPVIFWFLVGQTTQTQGTLWQLAGGAPRNIERLFDPQQQDAAQTQQNSLASVHDFLSRYGYVSQQEALTERLNSAEPIKVSTFFAWYTHLIASIVNEISKAVIVHANDENLLFVARNRAFEMIVSANTTNQDLIQMLVGTMFTKCAHFMDINSTISNPVLGQRNLDQLGNDQGKANLKSYLTAQRTQLEAMRSKEAARLVHPDDAMLSFMRLNSDNGQVQNAVNHFTTRNPAYQGKSFDSMRDQLEISCEDAWNVTYEKVRESADSFAGRLEKQIGAEAPELLKSTDPKKKELFCRMMGRKLTTYPYPDDEPCDLINVFMIFVIRNTIQELPLSQIANQEKQRFLDVQAVDNGTLFPKIAENRRDWVMLDDPRNPKITIDKDTGKQKTLFLNVHTGEVQPYEFTDVQEIHGHWRAACQEQQAWETRGIRQSIYTYAMNLPYWQGIALYMISVAYPFLCLLVLVPGRAISFMAVPLFWFWIKSWDIGFAVVMVLDEILWQLFPHYDLNPRPATNDLATMLSEALKVDCTYHVHQYYMFISMALLLVPAITGYATLKARRAILSSFTDGPRQAANEVQQLTSQAHGTSRSNAIKRAELGLSGAALLMYAGDPKKLMNSEAGNTALAFGVAKLGIAEAKGLGKPGTSIRENATGGGATSGALKNATGTYMNVLKAEAKYRGFYASSFDPTFGRWGRNQMMIDAHIAAMDGSGTYEVMDHQHGSTNGPGATSALIDLLATKANELANMGGDILGTAVSVASNGKGLLRGGSEEAQERFEERAAAIAAQLGTANGLVQAGSASRSQAEDLMLEKRRAAEEAARIPSADRSNPLDFWQRMMLSYMNVSPESADELKKPGAVDPTVDFDDYFEDEPKRKGRKVQRSVILQQPKQQKK